jgi:hypothetical protein
MIFELHDPVLIQPNTLTALSINSGHDTIRVNVRAWYDVWMMVQWDESATNGTRFAHTKFLNGNPPLHSEAINADVLSKISGGKQILRGNTIISPEDEFSLEVWHDSEYPVEIKNAYVKF